MLQFKQLEGCKLANDMHDKAANDACMVVKDSRVRSYVEDQIRHTTKEQHIACNYMVQGDKCKDSPSTLVIGFNAMMAHVLSQ